MVVSSQFANMRAVLLSLSEALDMLMNYIFKIQGGFLTGVP